MKKRFQIGFYVLILLIFSACGPSSSGPAGAEPLDSNKVIEPAPLPVATEEQHTDLDLAKSGIPVTLSVPVGAETSKGMMNAPINEVMNYDILINKDRFKLEVSMMDEEPENTMAEVINMNKAADRGDSDFHRFLLEEPQGYITELEIDGEFDFRCFYIIEKNQRHIEMTEGLSMKSYSESEIRAIYEACKTAR